MRVSCDDTPHFSHVWRIRPPDAPIFIGHCAHDHTCLDVVSCVRYPPYHNAPLGSGLHFATLKRNEVHLSNTTSLALSSTSKRVGAGLVADRHGRPDKYSDSLNCLPIETGSPSLSSHFFTLTALLMSCFIGGGMPAAISKSF
jgi:hypothetical protein